MIKVWKEGMSAEEGKNIAYWERNMLALFLADGWYNDDTNVPFPPPHAGFMVVPRFPGWRRVLSIHKGKMTFHVPDDFDVGSLPEIKPNWDGHTTEEKWQRFADLMDVKL